MLWASFVQLGAQLRTVYLGHRVLCSLYVWTGTLGSLICIFCDHFTVIAYTNALMSDFFLRLLYAGMLMFVLVCLILWLLPSTPSLIDTVESPRLFLSLASILKQFRVREHTSSFFAFEDSVLNDLLQQSNIVSKQYVESRQTFFYITPKVLAGKLYLNGPSATRVFFDCETAVGKDAFERMRLRGKLFNIFSIYLFIFFVSTVTCLYHSYFLADCQVVGQTRKGLHQRWSTLKRLNPSQSLILTSLY